MDEFCKSLANMKIHTPSYLPRDVVENILSRLSVKSLLRLKVVSKQWSAIISDSIFVHIHLQQSQNSLYSYIQPETYQPYQPETQSLRRVAFENHEFRELSPFEYPPPVLKQLGYRLWCFCDGLFLISLYNHEEDCFTDYVLWNPSRRTYKELHYPNPVDSNSRQRFFGICYNSSVKDYKVVIINGEHYAVFSCKNNSWSEMMSSNAISFNNFKTSFFPRVGVAYKESIYWIMHSALKDRSQIICFDGRDEKLKILCNLDYADNHGLFTSRDGLYLIPSSVWMRREMVMRKILPVWMEHKLQLPFSGMYPLGFTQQNKVIFLQLFDDRNCLLYDYSGRCFEDATIQPSFNFSYFRLLPYIENLFLL